jgi:hypothetical protein
MRLIRNASLAVAAFLLPLALPGSWALAHEMHKQQENTIVLRVGSSSWTYTHAQLVAMAKDKIPNMKGTRQKPFIPLQTILLKDTNLKRDQIGMIFVIGEKITILRGNDLNYLDKLILATGPDKGGKPHPWALTTEDEVTHKALMPHMGWRRKVAIYRIDIVRREDGPR